MYFFIISSAAAECNVIFKYIYGQHEDESTNV